MSRSRKRAYLVFALGVVAAGAVVASEDKSPAPGPGSSPQTQAQTSAQPSQTNDLKGNDPKSRQPWSWLPIQAPSVPTSADAAWVRTPIDAYILKALEDKGLKPSEDAAREVFIRRATLDVWGLIPTPEAVSAFVTDKSPDAYEKLIDRLLASPHYGERQARAWLDLARYADSAGFQQDLTRPNNWRYRDYVINAFNSDKPYDQFIREQVAGDEILTIRIFA